VSQLHADGWSVILFFCTAYPWSLHKVCSCIVYCGPAAADPHSQRTSRSIFQTPNLELAKGPEVEHVGRGFRKGV